MFNVVPSNRQEYLLLVLIELLKKDYQHAGIGTFDPSIIMVESLGMQHYVHKGIAQSCGVAMNIQYPLVSRGIYDLCRKILGDENVPKESPFKREVLSWRIEKHLRDDAFQAHSEAEPANQYWQNNLDPERARFALAQQCADVFEQYMQFRPQWLDAWKKGENIGFISPNSQTRQLLEPWQRLLWQAMVSDDELYPSQIIDHATKTLSQAIAEGQEHQFELPSSLYMFAVNTLTPSQLAFLKVLGSAPKVNIYFFHLNPCMEYWGDLISESALLRSKLHQGIDRLSDEDSPNSLLANLGKQGRVLFNQLQDLDYLSFADKQLFDSSLGKQQEERSKLSLLRAVQLDILEATNTAMRAIDDDDNSIIIHSCHSPLREVQVLHDSLLHIIQESSADGPQAIYAHDIIVLCPAVEDYAPYVNAVFRNVELDDSADEPRLVCSIADRAPLDADPMISMFMDMLNLPDARFCATTLIDYLQIETVQDKFGLSAQDLLLCEQWIADANIYWGENAEHKAAQIGVSSTDERYTWEWGLSRLLKSALFADSDADTLNFAMLHNVEGQQIQILANLMLFIETLREISRSMSHARTMSNWISHARDNIISTLFDESEPTRASRALSRSLEQLNHHVVKAQHEDKVSLSVFREALKSLLSRPDALNQFNTGQVTFCSMLPMRSVPFKVLCILGLNDGVFPRVSQPLSIDLMAMDQAQSTDRSRRTEDRYMFLEALVSARQYLYLSYQGRQIKDNAPREPSLVLAEFMQYLKQTYHVELLQEHSLQAFSPKNFTTLESSKIGQKPSYSKAWLTIASAEPTPHEMHRPAFMLPNKIHSSELVQFVEDPLKAFAEQHLQLHFERFVDIQGDVEPFELSSLVSYQLNQHVIACASSAEQANFETRLTKAQAAGDVPAVEHYSQLYRQAYQQITSYQEYLDENGQSNQRYVREIALESSIVQMQTEMLCDENFNSRVLLKVPVKNKHLFEFCVQHAIKRLDLGKACESHLQYVDIKSYIKQLSLAIQQENTELPEPPIKNLVLNDDTFAAQDCSAFLVKLLSAFSLGMQAPMMFHLQLGTDANAKMHSHNESYLHCQSAMNAIQNCLENPYFCNDYQHYFYPLGIEIDEVPIQFISELYFKHLPYAWELRP